MRFWGNDHEPIYVTRHDIEIVDGLFTPKYSEIGGAFAHGANDACAGVRLNLDGDVRVIPRESPQRIGGKTEQCRFVGRRANMPPRTFCRR